MEHKIATYRHHITRMHSLPLTQKWKQTEWTSIQLIMQNNNVPQRLIQNLNLRKRNKRGGEQTNKKMDNIHILQPQVRKITNLFKHTNIGISFKSMNTIQQLTKPKLTRNTQEQDKSSIYKLMCNTCQMSYIGQTSYSLKQRYQELVRYIRHNEPQ